MSLPEPTQVSKDKNVLELCGAVNTTLTLYIDYKDSEDISLGHWFGLELCLYVPAKKANNYSCMYANIMVFKSYFDHATFFGIKIGGLTSVGTIKLEICRLLEYTNISVKLTVKETISMQFAVSIMKRSKSSISHLGNTL